MKKVYAGIIGFGYMGHYHFNKQKTVNNLVFKAVFDISSEARKDAENEGLIAYETLEELLFDNEISLIFVCTPNNVHAYYAKRALESYKNVMVEKPITMNVKELEELISLAKKKKVLLSVHQNRRWDSDFLSVKKVVKSEMIGSVKTIESKVFGQKGICYGWRAEPEFGGGMLYDWGIHLIDQALNMFKGNKLISVHAHTKSILTPKVDDYFDLQLLFDNFVNMRISVGTFSLQHQPRWLVLGDRGTLVLDEFSNRKGKISRIKGNVEGFNSKSGKYEIGPSRTMAPLKAENIKEMEIPIVEVVNDDYHNNLIECINGTENSYIKYSEMLRAMKILELAFESARKNMVMQVNI